jgi:hypothetical protein
MTRLATAQRGLVPAGREGGSEGSRILGRLNELPDSVDQSPIQALMHSPQDETLNHHRWSRFHRSVHEPTRRLAAIPELPASCLEDLEAAI